MANAKILSWGSINSYLKLIGVISGIDIQRVREIFSKSKILCPEELRMIFISNYAETNGKEQFKDLWLFSDNYVIESMNFSKQEKLTLEIALFSKNIQTASIEASNFDFLQKPEDDSRLHVQFYTFSDFSCDQIASGHNCKVLLSIYEKYIKHNMVRGQSSGLH